MLVAKEGGIGARVGGLSSNPNTNTVGVTYSFDDLLLVAFNKVRQFRACAIVPNQTRILRIGVEQLQQLL